MYSSTKEVHIFQFFKGYKGIMSTFLVNNVSKDEGLISIEEYKANNSDTILGKIK